MDDLSLFLQGNKKKKKNAAYTVTKSLCDEKGIPLKWMIRPITTKENEAIRESCLQEVPANEKGGHYQMKLDMSGYMAKVIAASIVEPNLYNAALQDSYGVKTPEDLLMEMVDDPGEYNALSEFVQSLNGFDESMEEKVEQAKN